MRDFFKALKPGHLAYALVFSVMLAFAGNALADEADVARVKQEVAKDEAAIRRQKLEVKREKKKRAHDRRELDSSLLNGDTVGARRERDEISREDAMIARDKAMLKTERAKRRRDVASLHRRQGNARR
jgi:hypothetical protein